MNPKDYCSLLFDDETFSRSRLYFWIIGFIIEVHPCIEDNITQWNLYQRARIQPLLDDLNSKDQAEVTKVERSIAKSITKYDKEGNEIKQDLENLKKRFDEISESVRALRDGLFNASALMESRSATRLGQNVQLLTYVSIFYLPLGFCAALWAVPNIDQFNTRKAFIIATCLVSLVTLTVVFNMGNISDALGLTYFHWRKKTLQAMENDPNTKWQGRRGRFDEFPPNIERRVASEWWIAHYQAYQLGRKVKDGLKTFKGRFTGREANSDSIPASGTGNV
ncbi:hypothetical protein B0H65DRAFT_416578 [Neurospora tetraspora]|uniref:Uncharacterized protein n=1 Tax=Neurospora tetraspora TaxID=94610 RepID=A0AAE0JPG2_9PEZI|nr:hypothetical protein B0H65DRAFT_416578 [Neurospora tetraspora]